jgi:hypothetical protein
MRLAQSEEPGTWAYDLEREAGGVDSEIWREIQYDPQVDRARYDAMARYRRIALGVATEQDIRAEHRSGALDRAVERRESERGEWEEL